MPRIRCHYLDCVFIDDLYCSAAAVELDPDTGCATYSAVDVIRVSAEKWDERELEENEEDDIEDDDDDLWSDEDEDEEEY